MNPSKVTSVLAHVYSVTTTESVVPEWRATVFMVDVLTQPSILPRQPPSTRYKSNAQVCPAPVGLHFRTDTNFRNASERFVECLERF